MTTEWALVRLVVSSAGACVVSVLCILWLLEDYHESTKKWPSVVAVILFSSLFVLCGTVGIAAGFALRVLLGAP